MSSVNLTLTGPSDMAASLASRIRVLRLLRGWTQATLSRRAGVTASSYRRFETTGHASLELVLKVAHALSRLNEFEQLFEPPPARSIEQLEQRITQPIRKRGHI
ncbi:MAG TPA: helix-turn-helix transcriptional regulator [Myxococcota bacterium]|nr:helix-turn-helix transcriptional regulator [Myxococcota bacterium]